MPAGGAALRAARAMPLRCRRRLLGGVGLALPLPLARVGAGFADDGGEAIR